MLFALWALACAGETPVRDWENTAVNALNREPARAYSMPLASVQAALTDALEPETPYRLSLNGDWKFNWAGNPALRPLDFWKTDFNDGDWFTIDVPSCVEMRGFGSPGYTNVRYPHANKWPRILDRDTEKPDYNPVSSYRRTFTVPDAWRGRDVFVRFDGVYSAYYVWVNGQKAGYAEDSKLPSEFNITSFLKPGDNLIAVEVYRWCDGSYLEDQDMFRFSGIYRDVTLFATPKVRLDDFFVRESFSADYRNATLTLETTVRGGTGTEKVTAELYDAAFQRVGAFTGRLDVPNVHLWSAEDPYLYTLVMKAGEDIRACRVGFKDVKRSGNMVLFNGKPIKFKGVNRHECDVENGRTVSLEDMIRDVTLFKQYNINTVRTCHYPDHHTFYDLCDRYGIYMVAEANVEGHEPGYGKDGLGEHKEWYSSILERNVRNVENYKNHPAVFMWSMGNETGHGDGFRNAIKAVKARDPSRLVHWERGNADADVDSTMYPSVEWLEKRGKLGNVKTGGLSGEGGGSGFAISGHTAGKPHFMCEYAHAMGNAVGNLQEYWDLIYTYPALMGGCIWDWVDQAMWKDTDRVDPKTGKPVRFLAYGGDWDEEPNDGPFCVNGVVDPLRRVSAKLVEVGHVYRNIVVLSADAAKGQAVVWNRSGFTATDAFNASWEVLEDGVKIDGGTWTFPAVPPLTRRTVALPQPTVALDTAKEHFYNVAFTLKADTRWAKAGWAVARDQMPFGATPAAMGPVPVSGPTPVVKESEKTVEVKAGETEAVFCRKSGTLARLEMNGCTILKDPAPGLVAGPQFTCARAFTDNDRWLRDGNPWGENRKQSFYASGLTQLRYHASPIKVSFPGGNTVCVTARVKVTGSKSAGFDHVSEWTFRADGTVTVKNTVTPFGVMPPALARVGTTWRLDPALENMSYYGRGPRENYIDRKTGSFFGEWTSTVTEQYEPYVRPQDNGYKCDVRSVTFTDGRGRGVRFTGSQPLFVQALHYSMEDMERARHRNGEKRFNTPLVAHPDVFLNLDVEQLGLGGASCGPVPMQKYVFPIREESWSVTLTPVVGKKFLGLF